MMEQHNLLLICNGSYKLFTKTEIIIIIIDDLLTITYYYCKSYVKCL